MKNDTVFKGISDGKVFWFFIATVLGIIGLILKSVEGVLLAILIAIMAK